jgi:Amt family ammonium transporter
MFLQSSNLQRGAIALLLTLLSAQAFGQELNGANTSWIMTSTALVLFMTIPGLSLFYAGLVRSKNVLSVLMQCFAITCLASIIWLAFGYSIAFGDGGSFNAYFGNLDNILMGNITEGSMAGDIPESVFAMFQMTFAVITPALIVGAFAERMRFSAMLVFSGLWLVACIRAHYPLGLGRRLVRRNGSSRFRWWYCSSHHSRCWCTGCSTGYW